MAKLCAKGKAAAKRKFKVYPSAYANMYASAVCSGKVTPGGKKTKRKKFQKGSPKIFDQLETKVPYPKGHRVEYKRGGIAKGCGKVMSNRRKKTKYV